MERFSRRIAALTLATLASLAGTAQAQVVISQVYGGGGNSGAPLKSDFIELHNTGATPVDLTGWSVQYGSSGGSTWQRTLLSGSIAPGGYFLVKQADGAGSQPALPAPDVVGTISMSGSAGKVALVNTTAALSGACPLGSIDFVGFGGANCAEGSAPTPNLSNTTAALRKADGCQDTDNNAADFTVVGPAPRNSGSTAVSCGPVARTLNLADASVAEGQSGTAALEFVAMLTQPAASPVRLRWSTVDGTARVADGDYVAVVNAEAVIPAGSDRISLSVTVAGDTRAEDDETLRVVLSSVTGADAGDIDATGTIINDDFPIVPISQIQGAGERSPLAGRVVATRGLVTARRANGFFIQSRDIDADADPATSEGIFVFTRTMPDAVAPGRWLVVRGSVIEYVPSNDPGQAPLTELGGTVTVIEEDAATYPLPAPVVLTADFPSSTGGLDQLERLEGMRVTVPRFTVTAPTGGFTNEKTASGGSNGVFSGVVEGVARPFREPGIQAPDAPPAGSIPPIPVWDSNPELIAVDSDALGVPALDVPAGAVLEGLTGPLDYSFRRYTILPEATPVVASTVAPRAAHEAPQDAFTVAGYNMERFFDETNDPAIGEPVLFADAFERRLSKASLGIRESLRTPDILAVVEMENLAVLERLAARVNADAVAAGDLDPRYAAHLLDGNDVGGIDVGFLVRTDAVTGDVPRVEVRAVTQVGKDTLWTQPDGSADVLNDRPPLALDAVVHYADGRSFPITVIAVHQRSLIGAEDATPQGERVRGKRQRQAEFLAAYLDARQTSEPDLRLMVLGDFNAFEFNDGLVDAMGTVTGTPSPDAQTAVPGDGADLVEPNLVNLGTLEPQTERYSFIFGGNAQTLDHVLVNESLVVATRGLSIDHARINADFPQVNRNDAASPSRLADHDPVVAYVVPRRIADLGVTATAAAESHTGGTLRFDVDVSNAGPEQADRATVAFDLDVELPAATVAAPAGWECGITELTAALTRLLCRTDAMANGVTTRFEVSVPAAAALLGRTVSLVTAVATQSWDRNAANDSAAAQTTVVSIADLAVELAGPGQHLRRGTVGRYRPAVSNLGADLAVAPELLLWGDAPAANVQILPPAGWDCEVVEAAAGFRALCAATELSAGASQDFDLRIVGPSRPGSPFLTVRAQVTSRSVDTAAANDDASHRLVLIGSPR